MVLLVLAPEWERHLKYVEPILDEKGIPYYLYSGDVYPHDASASYGFSENLSECKLLINDKLLDLSEVTSVWNLRKGTSQPHLEKDPFLNRYIQKESDHVLDSLPYLMPKAFWVNHPEANRRVLKPYQLSLAQAIGFKIPETIIGNNAEKALEFAEFQQKKGHDLCIKTINSAAVIKSKPFIKKAYRYLKHKMNINKGIQYDPYFNLDELLYADIFPIRSRKINPINFLNESGNIPHCPIIIQAYIPKAYELRINIIGNQIFTSAIYSQEHEETKIDWRQNNSNIDLTFKPYDLPDKIKEQCFEIARQIGLQFGTIDMIVTPDKDYIFLEVNARRATWGFVQMRTGLPIREAMVDLLSNPSKYQLN